MPVDKEQLKYCANFARVTPRVTPLPKGCMCPPPYCARSSLVRGYPTGAQTGGKVRPISTAEVTRKVTRAYYAH